MSQVHQADEATFDSVVLRHDGAVLVDFGATWCGPGKKLEPIVHEIAGDFDGRLKVVKVEPAADWGLRQRIPLLRSTMAI